MGLTKALKAKSCGFPKSLRMKSPSGERDVWNLEGPRIALIEEEHAFP